MRLIGYARIDIPKLISKYELGYFFLVARKTKQAAPPKPWLEHLWVLLFSPVFGHWVEPIVQQGRAGAVAVTDTNGCGIKKFGSKL